MRRNPAAAALALVAAFLLPTPTQLAHGGDNPALSAALEKQVIAPEAPLASAQAFIEARIARIPEFNSQSDWQSYAKTLRARILDEIVFRGEAATWRQAATRVEWLDTIPGGPGYQIRKLRYEALPGFWIPALWYEPTEPTEPGDPRPAVLNLGGHEAEGKSVDYKQIRCIHLAKRGIVSLHPEWLGMGQLRAAEYAHSRMNQLDLCGASGLAVFYLAMSRGLDLLNAHPQVDPQRIAVTGLSGGGWQTAVLSALDPRVKVANPVAGYTSLRTAIYFKDLGDSEQAPCDLAAIADGTHLTALRAPQPTLLTYNAADECCFKAEHTLQPLLDAARPIFALFGGKQHLRSHVNHLPGTHNYDRDNRQVFFELIDDYFFPVAKTNWIVESDVSAEVKSSAELDVRLPGNNLSFSTVAKRLSASLPVGAEFPADAASLETWQSARRARLRSLLRIPTINAQQIDRQAQASADPPLASISFELGDWRVPVTLVGDNSKPHPIAVCVADTGRASQSQTIGRLIDQHYTVAAVDPLLIGQSQITGSDPQVYFALAMASVGERPLGIQAAQLAALARHFARDGQPIHLFATGRRSSLAALVAGAIEPAAVASVHLTDTLLSLRQLIDENRIVEDFPELFPFGLFAEFDIADIAALLAPRELQIENSGTPPQQQWSRLVKLYQMLGVPDRCRIQ